MILYIIKSILCSGLLLAVYFLFLQREKTLQFNRFYLLLAIPFSLIIPFLTIEITTLSPINQNLSLLYEETKPIFQSEALPAIVESPEDTKTSYLTIVLYGYMLISLLLLVRFLNNLLKITKTIRLHTIKPINNACLIVVDNPIIPHTFLHYIFISKADVENAQILTHELTHARQKHSLDILFIELVQCLFWINPFIFLYKRAIKLNHEFIADEAVANNCSDVTEYQQLLLVKADTIFQSPFSSSFSYALTKKRFIMMTTQKNARRSVNKITISLILTCSVTFLFSEKVYSQGTDESKSTVAADTVKGVTPDMMLEFEILTNQYSIRSKSYPDIIAINKTGLPESERLRMKEIYESMNAEQKAKFPHSVIYIIVPTPSPKKQSPTLEQLTSWKDSKLYGVWLDGKRINNDALKRIKPTDVSFYSVSKLLNNAVHYGQYKYQVDLMTTAYFDKTYPPKSE